MRWSAMKILLTISKWELTRIRGRFRGKSRFIIPAIILLAFGISYLLYHQGLVISKGLYRIGASFDGPAISDQRFQVKRLGQSTGYTMLNQGTLDAYIDGGKVISRNDERSQYAANALIKYLKRQELIQIAAHYEINRAFPLRVEINYLDTADSRMSIEIKSEAPAADEPKESPLSSVLPQTEDIREPILTLKSESTDAAVRKQLQELQEGGLPGLKESFLSEKDILVPSLMTPPLHLAQAMFGFFYVLPILFASVFFASSLTEERISRKLVILLSAPVSPLQVILGKMLPYLLYSLVVISAITLLLRSNLLLSLAIFLPVTLFVLSAYLMIALTYRTFKDQTFFSVLVLSAITGYLVIPTLLAGVNELSYISPLTLAVEAYRGETVTANKYFLATAPLYLVFFQTMFIGMRVFNEEYLANFKPLHIKVAEMFHMTVDKNHLNISVFLLSIFLLPLVFMAQLASIVLVSNVPVSTALWILVMVSAAIEELAKSAGIIMLLKSGTIKTKMEVARLSALSALGFFSGEKLLLFLALSVISESAFTSAVFGSGLLIIPLFLHIFTTCTVCLMTAYTGSKYYPLALLLGIAIHAVYNIFMIRAFF